MRLSIELRDWKVGTRLTLGFGLILALLVVVALLGIMGIQQARSLHETFEQALVTQHQCDQLKELLALDVTKSQAIIRSVGMPEVADRFKPELQTADKAIESLLTAMSAQSTSNIQQTTQTLIGQYKAYKKTRDEVLNLVELGQTIEANDKEQTKLAPAAQAVAVSSDDLKTHVSENTRAATSALHANHADIPHPDCVAHLSDLVWRHAVGMGDCTIDQPASACRHAHQ